jgi:hypothetical protein
MAPMKHQFLKQAWKCHLWTLMDCMRCEAIHTIIRESGTLVEVSVEESINPKYSYKGEKTLAPFQL